MIQPLLPRSPRLADAPRGPRARLFLAVTVAITVAACGGAPRRRPAGPPPEYEEPAVATPTSTPTGDGDAGAQGAASLDAGVP